MSSEYERIRLKNIEDNKRVLSELGFLNPFKPLPHIFKKVRPLGLSSLKRKNSTSDYQPSSKKYIINDGSCENKTERIAKICRRRSGRLQGKNADDVASDDFYQSLDDEDVESKVTILRDRPFVYGHIPGVPIGMAWQMRIEVNYAGIHRPTVAGIHPGPEGAYSIALSGGYQDDIDLGDCFTYTGEGGRDLKGTKANPKNLRTAAQTKDQSLSRGNQALVRSAETGFPVRVLRGYKLDSPFAPDCGYRYDGLYKVEKWWYTTGLAGFGVYKFALRRIDGQAPPPWEYKLDQATEQTVADNQSDTAVIKVQDENLTGNVLSESNKMSPTRTVVDVKTAIDQQLSSVKGEVPDESGLESVCDENMNKIDPEVERNDD